MQPVVPTSVFRELAALEEPPAPPRRCWSWAVCRIDAKGRVRLPGEARAVLGATGAATVPARCTSTALVLDPGGAGASTRIDDRGRVRLPMWLRQRAVDVLVGADPGTSTVLVTPTTVLDGIGGLLAVRR